MISALPKARLRVRPGAHVLAPGKHRISARLEGYETATRELNLAAGETQTLDVALEREPSPIESPWLWAGIAAGLAAGAAIAIFALRPTERDVCLVTAEHPCLR